MLVLERAGVGGSEWWSTKLVFFFYPLGHPEQLEPMPAPIEPITAIFWGEPQKHLGNMEVLRI